MARPACELLMLVYLFSIRHLATSKTLEILGTSLGLFYCASILLFLATLVSPVARDLRMTLYADTVARSASVEESGGDTESVDVQQGGFSYLLHTFGYQLAAGVPFIAGLALLDPSRKRSYWTLALASGVAALAMAGQRSAVLASGIAFIGLLSWTSGWVRKTAVAALVAAACAGFLAAPGLEDVRTYNTALRFRTSADAENRLDLQVWTLSQSLRYPIGIAGDQVDYASIAPVWTARGPLAPHNGYLTRLLWYGWGVGALTLGILAVLTRMAACSWRAWRKQFAMPLECVGLWALIGVMINALFHNASFVTFNADTLVILFFYCASYSVRRAASLRLNGDRSASSLTALA
jgi:hypothetical protein